MTPHHLTTLIYLAADPITVNPTAPPGSDKLLNIVSWGGWIGMVAAVVALIYNGAKFGYERKQGTASNDAATSVAWTCAGCVVMAMAGGLVGAIV
ncbi:MULTISPECIES: hypothetical protein [Gordonia]|uniref:Integral membrane protein n=1 Tax=Gordonia tangerina TaxID=2911060 RepID=A0ABS9DNC5_9ACTN|nr:MULTISPECIES: hypothetical protein [Gordonia]MAU80850.1 hypothetical protein [Gordonia sp. (in: high G+C Gram-positive bacteria)]MCF3940656.1 hypothetical protein [Gordonia tangerina]